MEWRSIQGAKQCCTSQPQTCRVNDAVAGCSMNRSLQGKVHLNSPAGYTRSFVSVQEECIIFIACLLPLFLLLLDNRGFFIPLYLGFVLTALCWSAYFFLYGCASESNTGSRERSVLSYSTLSLQCIVSHSQAFWFHLLY